MRRHEQLAQSIEAQITAGVLRAGERLPSVRVLSAAHRMSPATVQLAYHLLEDRGRIESRPRSGHYVRAQLGQAGRAAEPRVSRPARISVAVDVSELVFEILGTAGRKDVVPLGSAFIDPGIFPLDRLARSLSTAVRKLDPAAMVASLPPGDPDLRRAIARRYLAAGVDVPVDEIVVTAGGLEALNLCLQVVTRPGDVVAIESPAFYGALQAIERLGLKALELPTHPREGVDLGALESAIRRGGVRVCWLMTNFQNPLGALMPEAKKEALVRLLGRHGVPLIEDDVYEELYFGARKPRPAKAWDRQGLVMHCSSFSKCLAPGYRVGWAAPGRHAEAVRRLKLMSSISASIPAQAAVADFLRNGGYDHHLRGLRAKLRMQQQRMIAALEGALPAGCRITRPEGGYFVWVELPERVSALEVHATAMRSGISVAPGPIFSPQRRYANCLRINTGQPWTPRIDAALLRLGGIVRALA